MQNNMLRKKFDMDKYLEIVERRRYSYPCTKVFTCNREAMKYMSILWHSVSIKIITRLAKDLMFPHPRTAIMLAIGKPLVSVERDVETLHAYSFDVMKEKIFDKLYSTNHAYSKIEIAHEKGGKAEFVTSRHKIMTDPYQCVLFMTFVACKKLEDSLNGGKKAPDGFITATVKAFEQAISEKTLKKL